MLKTAYVFLALWIGALAMNNSLNGPLLIECGVNIPFICSE